MTTKQHTPGPWSLVARKCGIGCCDDIQRVVAKYPDDEADDRGVATVDGSNAVWLRAGEAEANAALIAAAPDLLAACEAALAVFCGSGYGGAPGTTDAIGILHAAIAKARNEQESR